MIINTNSTIFQWIDGLHIWIVSCIIYRIYSILTDANLKKQGIWEVSEPNMAGAWTRPCVYRYDTQQNNSDGPCFGRTDAWTSLGASCYRRLSQLFLVSGHTWMRGIVTSLIKCSSEGREGDGMERVAVLGADGKRGNILRKMLSMEMIARKFRKGMRRCSREKM